MKYILGTNILYIFHISKLWQPSFKRWRMWKFCKWRSLYLYGKIMFKAIKRCVNSSKLVFTDKRENLPTGMWFRRYQVLLVPEITRKIIHYFGSSNNQEGSCGDVGDCTTCISSKNNCGWCDNTQVCVDSNDQCPELSKESITFWFWLIKREAYF